MDPFTQKLLERTRLRRENLQKKLQDSGGKVSESIESSAAAKLVEELSPSKSSTTPKSILQVVPPSNTSQTSEVVPEKPAPSSPSRPIPAPRSVVTPERPSKPPSLGSPTKAKFEKENELKPDTPAISSVKSRMQQLAANRDDWDNAVTAILAEDEAPPNRGQPQLKTPSQGGRFAHLAAKINSWDDDGGASPRANHPSGRSKPSSVPKPNPFESPVPRIQRRLSGGSSTKAEGKAFQFGPKPVAPVVKEFSSTEVPPNKPPRVPDSPSKATPTSQPGGVFRSPPRSTVLARAPSPTPKTSLTTKPVSPKMKALQANLEAKLSSGWQESEIAKKAEEEKRRDMKSLLNRWEKVSANTEPPKPPPVGSTTPVARKAFVSAPSPAPSIASSIFSKKTTTLTKQHGFPPPAAVSTPKPTAPPPPPTQPAPASPKSPPPHVAAAPTSPKNAAPPPTVVPTSPGFGAVVPASMSPSKSKSRMMELALKSAGSTPPRGQQPPEQREVRQQAPREDDEAMDASTDEDVFEEVPVPPPRKRKSDRHLDRLAEGHRISTASSASGVSGCSEMSSVYETSSEARSSVASYREEYDDDEEDDEYDGTTNTEDEETEDETVTTGRAPTLQQQPHQSDENISDFLDAAFDGLEDTEEEEEEEGAPPLKKQASNSRVTGHRSPTKSSLRSAPPSSLQTPSKAVILQEGSSEKPVVYSVQEYRTMQRKKLDDRPYLDSHIIRESEHFYALKSGEEASTSKPVKNAQQKIKELQESVQSEQVVIAQASKALNAALQRPNFHGSTEMVECNRLLLLACQKRQACLEEIGRLKTLGWGQDTTNAGLGACRGTVTISDIRLPLKPRFLQMRSEGLDSFVHYYICMIKHGPQLIHTQMLSTVDGISGDHFYFSNRMVIRDIPPDFELRVDVYGLEVPKRSHAQKTQSHGSSSSSPKKSKKKKIGKHEKTPKKNKLLGFRSSSESSGHQSPINSFAVSTTSFTHLDSVAINAKSLCHDKFALAVSNSNPLSGVLYVKIQCHTDANVVERGFLTMFEDVSGLGAWHRRWIVLSGYKLSYWKYPDDENKKPPIGTIDLLDCISPLPVTIISRDICARPNTFALETMRPGRPGETETLVLKRSHDRANSMVERHMLSADTKEDRIVWCDVLNKALNNLRMWNPNALRPLPKREDCVGMGGKSKKGVPV